MGYHLINDRFCSFLNDIERITAPGYLPDQKDLLKARTKTTGISSLKFSVGCCDVVMTDLGGQRSERRKWNQIYQDDIIIFCVSLSEYDQTLLEAENQVHNALRYLLYFILNLIN